MVVVGTDILAPPELSRDDIPLFVTDRFMSAEIRLVLPFGLSVLVVLVFVVALCR